VGATRRGSDSQWPWVCRYAAAAALLGAALIHISQARPHFQEWFAAGITFLVVTVLELTLAISVILLPSKRVLAATMWTSTATVALWALSRTIGLPFGPEPYTPEAIGKPDLTSAVLEIGTVLLLTPVALRLRKGGAIDQRPRWPEGMLGVGAIGIAMVLLIFNAIQDPGEGACGSAHGGAASLTGPLVPIDGHSILSRNTPIAQAGVGERAGLLVGLLKNCGDSSATVESARLLGTTDFEHAVDTGDIWVVPPALAQPGRLVPMTQLRSDGTALPGQAVVSAGSAVGRYPGIVVEVHAVRPGMMIIDGLELTYRSGNESFTAPYADIARIHVRRNTS
jgi:hypothetical protein